MGRWIRAERAAIARVALLACFACAGSTAADEAALQFARHGAPVTTLDLEALRGVAEPRTLTVHEPYEDREVTFRVLPFPALLDAAFGAGWREEEELLFTCRDGYQPTIPVERVLRHDAFIAYAREDAAFSIRKFESGRHQEVSLAPFYLVWENRDDPVVHSEGDYGWPYQLVGVELVRGRDRFPRMTPADDAPTEVREGYAAFRRFCSRCHAVNGEGGSIGPELNAPGTAVGARDPAWLRRWIDDPARFASTARMPALDANLPDRARVLDTLVAYLQHMAEERPPDAR